MKYKFQLPNCIKLDRSKALIIHGGICPSVNVIYLYGFSTIDNVDINGEACLYERILEHEHLHSVLHKFGIPLKYHEKIIDELGMNR